MKNLVITLILVTLCANLFAQAPQGIPYQAVARNSSGAILANQAIRVRFTIHDSIATGTVVYQETFPPTTNTLGLFNVNVGTGSVVSGTFSNINWGHNFKFMQVEMDPAGGTSYTDMGTQQMMSVPYALHSKNGLPIGSAFGDILYWNGVDWVELSRGTNGQVLTTINDSLIWANPSVSSSNTHYIGMSYQGGVIAYILQPGDAGYNPIVPHGLIAAFNDQSSGAIFCTTTIAGISTAVGTGLSNTTIISSSCASSTAGRVCYDLVLGGYSDWYLPSKDELNKLFINRSLIGGFSDVTYYSSSALGTSASYGLDFVSGSWSSASGIIRIRAVRSF